MDLTEQHFWSGLRPVAFERPQYNGRTGRFYSATKYAKFKKELRAEFKPNGPARKDPCRVVIACGMGPPAKKNVAKHKAGVLRFTKVPDIDNLAKSILDGLNDLLWADDRQVVRLEVEKHYSDEPYVSVSVTWMLET